MKTYCCILLSFLAFQKSLCSDNHVNSKLIPSRGNCGTQKIYGERITGGEEARLGEFPWAASLFYDDMGTSIHKCGGILINARYILANNIYIGEHDSRIDPDCTNGPNKICAPKRQEMQLENSTIHENYNALTGQHDIALIRFTQNVQFNEFVKPACLPRNGETSPVGTILTVTGWGQTDTENVSPVKRKTELELITNQECSTIYQSFGHIIDNFRMCGGKSPATDSCVGDSGGPFMRQYPDGEDWYVQGMVKSGTIYCDSARYPSIYARLDTYIDWILDNLVPF